MLSPKKLKLTENTFLRALSKIQIISEPEEIFKYIIRESLLKERCLTYISIF